MLGGQEIAPTAESDCLGEGWVTALGSQASRGPTDTNCSSFSLITALDQYHLQRNQYSCIKFLDRQAVRELTHVGKQIYINHRPFRVPI